MSAFSGTAGSVVYTLGGTTVISGIGEWTLDLSLSPVETTSFGNTWDEQQSSVRTYTGSFSGNKDVSGQTSFAVKFTDGLPIGLKLYEDETHYWDTGIAYVTGMSPSVSIKGKGDISFNFQGAGVPSYT
jgi:hypothetical protein